jgi:molybdate transport system substrate-binding protein
MTRSDLPPRALTPLLAILLLALVLGACGGTSTGGMTSGPPVSLTVFAASSLTDAFKTIQPKFQVANPNVTITYSFGGSDTLATQITQGAPADVFASANTTQMNVAVKGGQIASASVKTFAHNRLVVIYPTANPADVLTLQDLAKPNLKLDLAASTVPVGQYALDFLTKASADSTFGADFKSKVLKNVVSYETDVRSVLTKVSLGEADAGIVYTTDAATKADSIKTIAIPDALNTVAVYPIAPIKGSAHADAAQRFVDYVVAADGQAVLAQYGFIAGTTGPQYLTPTPSA